MWENSKSGKMTLGVKNGEGRVDNKGRKAF